MTGDSLQRLRSLAEADDALMASLRAATSAEEVIRIAGEHDILLVPTDLGVGSEVSDEDVSDAELESATGGWHPKYGTFSDDCI